MAVNLSVDREIRLRGLSDRDTIKGTGEHDPDALKARRSMIEKHVTPSSQANPYATLTTEEWAAHVKKLEAKQVEKVETPKSEHEEVDF